MQNDLDQKIKQFEKDHSGEKTRLDKKSAPPAVRAGYEFILATLFFGGIGYVIDLQLGSLPYASLGLFFIGFATGVYNAWRVMNLSEDKVGFAKEKYLKNNDKMPD